MSDERYLRENLPITHDPQRTKYADKRYETGDIHDSEPEASGCRP